MAISFETITGIIRYHPSGGFGDPYTFACTVLLDGEQAIIKAAVGEYNKEVRKQIEDALHSIGVKVVHYERRNSRNGNPRSRTIETHVHPNVGDDNGERNAPDREGLSEGQD